MKAPIIIGALTLLTACGSTPLQSQPKSISSPITESQFNETQFRKDIKTLSSDEFEGRAPATEGEKKTTAYLTQSFKDMGLVGANNGSYLQTVPLVSYTTDEASVKITLDDLPLQYRKDVVVNSHHNQQHISIKNAPLVFVGYGINAPEYHWNDYAGIDMKGKIAVIMVNDPGFTRPNSGMFNGKAMTYYGRWDYKFIEASKQGAIGALIIHDTEPASYSWSVVENSWTGPQQNLAQQVNTETNKIKVEGWITKAIASKLFAKANINLAQVMKQAALKPLHIALDQKASFEFDNKIDHANSNNVIATLPGTNQSDEHILFIAHWDHIGKDETKQGDQIYNGALDNASGTAGIMEIARVFAKKAAKGEKLARSLTFIAATGEEQGLLGSRYYAKHPIYSLDKTVAVFNLDSTNIYGKTTDYTIIGKGKSQLENYLADAAKRQNRTVKSEKYPEAGGFFRSDHFSFAKYGVPAVFAGGGNEPIDEATAQYKNKMQKIRRGCYHNVCDEYREDWNLDGAIQNLTIFAEAARELGNSEQWPGYFKGTEFYQLRPAN